VQRAAAAIAIAAIVLAGCGSSKKKATTASSAQATAAGTTLALSISETGKGSKFTVPPSATGGLVTVQLTNLGKKPHGAQLIRVESGHTIAQALAILAPERPKKVPSWIHGEGGVGAAEPGATGSATVNLPAGSYGVVDIAASGEGGPPAVSTLTVSPGKEGPLPATGTTITAAAPSKDHFKWQISGPLKVGPSAITLVSKGSRTLHELTVGRITANVPIARIVKDLQSNGPPPSYVDPGVQYSTAVLDNGKAENTQLVLTKPGKYVFICHLTDRDGGKPHFAEGLITTVTVK
jgi:uncharacterized cupredoxin-like copper-binding protein